jgi:hypothetical protein
LQLLAHLLWEDQTTRSVDAYCGIHSGIMPWYFPLLMPFQCDLPDLPRETDPKNDRDEQNARPSFKSLLTPILQNAIQPSTQ